MATLKNSSFTNLTLPSGTTAQRPGSPSAGMLRYNTDINYLEFYNGSSWFPVTGTSKGTVGTGGDSIRWVGNDASRSSGGIIHVFTTVGSSTFTPTFTGNIEVLVVAGGGSGGSHWGGGGGGGGVIYNRAFPVSAGSPYSVTVGGGASRPSFPSAGNQGGNSVFSTLTAIGGGAGGSWNGDQARQSGGSGGGGPNGDANGSRFRYTGGPGTSGQGFRGGLGVRFNQQTDNTHMGGGGGGAGGPGMDASDNAYDGRLNHGGPGAASDIMGHTLYWGGGGGSTAHLGNGRTAAAGGIGGGGGSGIYHGGPRHPGDQRYGPGGGQAINAGGAATSIQASGNGGTNTGGGGGGSNYQYDGLGATGGSGIVVIRY